MSEKLHKSATQMDEELADFTDRILADQPVKESGINGELNSLEETVRQLKSTLKIPAPEITMQRIEKQLVKEWLNNRDAIKKTPSLWQKFLPDFKLWKSDQQRGLTLAFIFVVLFLIVVYPVSQIITPNIQGSAGNTDQYKVFLLVAAAILVIGLLWFGRNKS
jgi:hypothetical protein